MSDIVDTLRGHAAAARIALEDKAGFVFSKTMLEAADEIEQLRATLDAVRAGCKDKSDAYGFCAEGWKEWAEGWNAAMKRIETILEANDE